MSEKAYIKTFLYVWFYILGVSLIVLLVGDGFAAVSFFLGALVNVMLTSHNYRSSMRAAEEDPDRLQRVAVRNMIFRYLFYAFILLYAFINADLNPYLTFFGFLSFKLTMLAVYAFSSRKEEDAG